MADLDVPRCYTLVPAIIPGVQHEHVAHQRLFAPTNAELILARAAHCAYEHSNRWIEPENFKGEKPTVKITEYWFNPRNIDAPRPRPDKQTKRKTFTCTELLSVLAETSDAFLAAPGTASVSCACSHHMIFNSDLFERCKNAASPLLSTACYTLRRKFLVNKRAMPSLPKEVVHCDDLCFHTTLCQKCYEMGYKILFTQSDSGLTKACIDY